MLVGMTDIYLYVLVSNNSPHFKIGTCEAIAQDIKSMKSQYKKRLNKQLRFNVAWSFFVHCPANVANSMFRQLESRLGEYKEELAGSEWYSGKCFNEVLSMFETFNKVFELSRFRTGKLNDVKVESIPVTANVSIVLQKANCRKDTCKNCVSGPSHGPYYYAYWKQDGRTLCQYIGKELPERFRSKVDSSVQPSV